MWCRDDRPSYGAVNTSFFSDCADAACISLKWGAAARFEMATGNWIQDSATWNFYFRPGAFFSVVRSLWDKDIFLIDTISRY